MSGPHVERPPTFIAVDLRELTAVDALNGDCVEDYDSNAADRHRLGYYEAPNIDWDAEGLVAAPVLIEPPGASGMHVDRMAIYRAGAGQGCIAASTRQIRSVERPRSAYVGQSTERYCVSVNSSRPARAPSRPKPDCFIPPNGADGSDTRPRLIPIIPASIFSPMRSAR
jgi:hypothetical protein